MQSNETTTEQQKGNMPLMNNLLDFINEMEEDELEIPDHEPMSIESMDQANYYVRRLKEIQAEKKQIEDTAKAQIESYVEKVEQWLKSTTNPLDYSEEFLTGLLEVYTAGMLEGSSKKSLKLIEGTLGFRAQQPEYIYDDEALLNYVETSATDYLKTKPSVDKSALKKVAKIKGNQLFLGDKPVQGVTILKRDPKFSVK